MKQERIVSSTGTWNKDTIYALGLCRMLTQVLGIWPLECDNFFAKIRVLVVASLQISMNISLIRELIADCGPFNQMVDFVALLACSTLALLKVLVIRKNHEKMLRIIVSAMKDWSSIVDDDSRLIMIKHAYMGRFVFIFQLGSAYMGCVPMFLGTIIQLIMSLFSGPKISNLMGLNDTTINVTEAIRYLPMGTPCSVFEMATSMYVAIYVLQVVQLFMTCSCNIGTDVYFFILVMHVCGQFELLNDSIEKFGLGKIDENHFDDNYKQQLYEIVERHNHLARMTKYFEDIFNLIILAQLTASGIHISLLGIQFILGLRYGDVNTVIYVGIALSVLNLQLFLYSYAGDRLSSQIEIIRDAVYSCPWYNMSPKIVKNLIIMIMRSDCSFNLTAGKVYPMNIYNFKNIVKAIASYFSFLKLMLPA
nr:olfactory receptor 6 [Gregopimpla kuwanae]